MRHAASGLDGCRGCACYARRRRESTCENRTGTARSGLTRRPAAPCRGPASGVLPLPRACCCCSPSTQAKETLMKEASVSPMVEEKKLPKRGASKIARPRPAAGDEEENLSARRRRRKFCHCSLQKCLEHDGLVTPPDDIKVPESTQQMSNHWNVSGADGQRQHVQTGVTINSSLGRSAQTVAGVRAYGSVRNAIAGEGGKKSVPCSPKEMSSSSSPTFWCRSRAPA